MSEKGKIFQEINKILSEGRPFVVATIIQTAGSSPRRTGAKMLVFPDGSIFGTIGGGNFENLVIQDSVTLFTNNENTLLKKYSFSREGRESTGMCCGGEAKVFMEKFGNPRRLIVFGGGHVGRDIVRVSRDLDFTITIVDDRSDILESYEPGIETILTDERYSENFPGLDENCYVVIVTRSHDSDRIVLEQVLKSDCAYVGMIGSQKKISKVFQSLRDNGISEEKLSVVRAPVGLDIGGEGPYEIAISIAGELIAVIKGKLAQF